MGRFSKIVGIVLVALGFPLMAVVKLSAVRGVGLDLPFWKPPLVVSGTILLIPGLAMVIVGVALIVVGSRSRTRGN